MSGARQPLCRLAEIAEGASRGFDLGPAAEPREIFAVRQGDRLYGYVNSCPHLGASLEFMPDQFLTADGTQILCSTHGARFRIEDGHCVAGPCYGWSLEPVELEVDAEGRVFLAE